MRRPTDRLREHPLQPWLAQRLAARTEQDETLIVAARQTGKTSVAAAEVLRAALASPGTTSCVLAPTKQFLRRSVDKIVELAATLPGVQWREQKGRFELDNGSIIECVSAESAGGEATRGLTIHGVLWIDEAALVPDHAVKAARGCLLVGRGRVLVTTTPVGRNWVWRAWNRDTDDVARLRFRATDSPFMDAARLARERAELPPEVAAQELDAEFVDDLTIAFPDTSRLFVHTFPDRTKEPKASLGNVLGIDLGQKQDWLVVTLINKYGEAVVLERVQGLDWTDAKHMVADLAVEHEALVVLDDGPGGGAGAVLESDLRREKNVRTRLVHTAVHARKAEIVEQTRLDVRWEKIHVLVNPHAEQLRHELRLFQAIRRVVQGKEHVVYQGPQLRGEHDDCVISLCLAVWGRAQRAAELDGESVPDVAAELKWIAETNQKVARALLKQNTTVVDGVVMPPAWASTLPKRPPYFPFFPNP